MPLTFRIAIYAFKVFSEFLRGTFVLDNRVSRYEWLILILKGATYYGYYN